MYKQIKQNTIKQNTTTGDSKRLSRSLTGDGQVDFEEFVTLLGPKLTAGGLPDKFNGTDFDSLFWKVITRLCTNSQ